MADLNFFHSMDKNGVQKFVDSTCNNPHSKRVYINYIKRFFTFLCTSQGMVFLPQSDLIEDSREKLNNISNSLSTSSQEKKQESVNGSCSGHAVCGQAKATELCFNVHEMLIWAYKHMISGNTKNGDATIKRYFMSLLVLKYGLSIRNICNFKLAHWLEKSPDNTLSIGSQTFTLEETDVNDINNLYLRLRNKEQNSNYDNFFLTKNGHPFLQVGREINALKQLYVSQGDMATVVKSNICHSFKELCNYHPPLPDSFINTSIAKQFSNDPQTLMKRWRWQQLKNRSVEIVDIKFKYCNKMPSLSQIASACKQQGWANNRHMVTAIKHELQHRIRNRCRSKQHKGNTLSQKLHEYVTHQTWPGLALFNSGQCGKGQGIFTTETFDKGKVVCDYHGQICSAKQGKTIHSQSESVYSFFFTHNSTRYMIDSKDNPCQCHKHLETTVGRKINHSCKHANLRPCTYSFIDQNGKRSVTVLFKALVDIPIGSELFYDYGVRSADDGTKLDFLKE
jgi:hypothetical protein